MDPALREHIRETMPKFNPVLADGFATSQIPVADKYVHMLFKAISRSFPPGLEYTGFRPCLPSEELRQITKPKNQKNARKNNKSTYDIAESYLRMMMYTFKWKGKDLPPRYMFLPYVTDGGHIKISGSRYTISPVLADRVISILPKTVFVRLIKTRFMVLRMSQHYLMNGQDHSTHVVFSKIYQKQIVKDRNDPNRVNAHSTMPHYLFCKYGLSAAFQLFANCTPIVGDAQSITTEKYPASDWNIFMSSRVISGQPPSGRNDRLFYEPPAIRVAVRKSETTPMVEKMIGGLYYLLDLFPEQMKNVADFDKTLIWIRLLGYIVAPGTTSLGKLLKEMDDHMRSLDEYIDAIMQDQLANIDMHVDNVYQLFAILTERFDELLLKGSGQLSSMYDKELNVNYFVLYDISRAIVELGFKMMKLSEKPNLEEKEIISAFTSSIKPGLIYNIHKNVGSVSTNSYPGDNKALKITSLVVPQQASSKKSKGHNSLQLSDPINQLHVSIAEVGAYANLPKSQPSGWFRLSLYLSLDMENVVQRDPRFIPLFNSIQQWIDLP